MKFFVQPVIRSLKLMMICAGWNLIVFPAGAEVHVAPEIAADARLALERMLAL